MSPVLWHLLAYPLYQILGSLRHELSHAVVVWCTGGRVTSFCFWPGMLDGRFFWGYIRFEYPEGIDSTKYRRKIGVAPYILDLILVASWVVMTRLVDPEFMSLDNHLFLFATMAMLVSSVVNTLWALLKYAFTRTGDFAWVFDQGE